MSEAAPRQSERPPRAAARLTAPAIAGVALTVAGPTAYMLLLDHAFVRSSGAPAFVLMMAGVLVGLHAAWRDRRLWVRLGAGFDVLLTALFVYGFFGLSALPAAASQRLDLAPDFTLPDSTGRPVSLRETLAGGPVLLVFYRGFW